MKRETKNTILLVAVFFLVSNLLVLSTINNKLNYSMQASQRELTRLKEDNKILFLKVETANDLDEISYKAQNDLDMVFPKKIEYIYVK